MVLIRYLERTSPQTLMEITYAILKTLILPPGCLIVLLIFAFLASKRILARLLILLTTVLLTLLSLPFIASHLLASLEPYPALITEAPIPEDAQAIIVLSSETYSDAREYGSDIVGTRTLERVRYGAFLARRTGLPLYVTGGGSNDQHRAVGELMAESLDLEFGIKVAGVEAESRTTLENAKFSVPMLQDQGIGHVLLVTHAWHMPRAMEAFEREGLKVTAAPTRLTRVPDLEGQPILSDWLVSPHALVNSYFALHEYLGRAWYQLKSAGRSSAEPEPRSD